MSVITNSLKIKLLFPLIKLNITLWHIGRDALSEYSREMFHCKWDIAEKIILRIVIQLVVI